MSADRIKPTIAASVLVLGVLAFAAPPATAAIWSNTELHLQYGTLDVPSFAGGGRSGLGRTVCVRFAIGTVREST